MKKALKKKQKNPGKNRLNNKNGTFKIFRDEEDDKRRTKEETERIENGIDKGECSFIQGRKLKDKNDKKDYSKVVNTQQIR